MPRDAAASAARPGRTRPPARPSTVAGPTAGATSRLASTATRLTWPEIAATSGVQASCAAAGTATASASPPGQPPAERVAPPGAEQQDAGGGEHREGEADARSPDRAGRGAAPRPRRRAPGCPAGDRSLPSASSATEPIAAARSTLGSVRASSTNPAMPTRADDVQPPPADPAQRAEHQQEADHQRQVGARHREQVGQPGGAEVRRRGRRRRPASSPSTRAGTSARWSAGRCATEARSDARTASAPRHHSPGPAERPGPPLGAQHGREVRAVRAGRAGPRPAPRSQPDRRPAVVRRAPAPGRDGSQVAPGP